MKNCPNQKDVNYHCGHYRISVKINISCLVVLIPFKSVLEISIDIGRQALKSNHRRSVLPPSIWFVEQDHMRCHYVTIALFTSSESLNERHFL